jgi:hypothetical protein
VHFYSLMPRQRDYFPLVVQRFVSSGYADLFSRQIDGLIWTRRIVKR